MNTYFNLKILIEWAEKFDNQLSDGQQWHDKKLASWLSDEVGKENQVESGIPANTEAAITMYIAFMYKYALFYSRKIF